MVYRTREVYLGINIGVVDLTVGRDTVDGHLVTADSEPDFAAAIGRLADAAHGEEQREWGVTADEKELGA